MEGTLTGGCLCGRVRYTASAQPAVVGHCYCVDCRKSSGTSHGTHAAVPEDALSIAGELTFFDHPADSGNMIGRGFCPRCGSPVLSRNSGMPGLAFLRVSSLDDLNKVTPQMSVYTSRAAEWAVLDSSVPSFAEMPAGGPQAVIAAS